MASLDWLDTFFTKCQFLLLIFFQQEKYVKRNATEFHVQKADATS